MHVPLSSHVSIYYLTTPSKFPVNFPYPIMCMFLPPSSSSLCPFYAPVVPDALCIFCGNNAIDHRKYYLYSYFARIIQKYYFNWKFRLFCKKYVNKFILHTSSSLPFHILILKYKYLFYRKWNIETFKKYIK